MTTEPASLERLLPAPRRAPAALPHWRREQARAFATGLAPALFVLAVITLGPTVYLLVTSLTPLDPVHPHSALDFSDPLGNYQTLLGDGRFLNSVWVQTKLSVATVGLQLAIGLGVALLLNAGSRFLETAPNRRASCSASCATTSTSRAASTAAAKGSAALARCSSTAWPCAPA